MSTIYCVREAERPSTSLNPQPQRRPTSELITSTFAMNISKSHLAALGALLSGGAAVSAFSIQPRGVAPSLARGPSASALAMADYDDSYPSDSSEDAHFSVEQTEGDAIDVENKPSTASESVVSSILDYLPGSLASSGEMTSEDRAAINESILKLEALNPTEDPVYSPLINGVWMLKYAGGYSESKLPSPTRDLALFLYSGGYSPGLFALTLAQKLPPQLVELGDLEICESKPYSDSAPISLLQFSY